MNVMSPLLFISWLTFAMACQPSDSEDELIDDKTSYAIVENVSASGDEGNYTFSVTIKSPDKGCEQYADWWEVFSENGDLIYRRILAHSHVNEQPFTRSGGSVNISATEIVIIRGHMNNLGYGEGEVAMKGSVSTGFHPFTISKDLAADIEKELPQPTDCAF